MTIASLTTAEMTDCKQSVNITALPKRKPGRPKMSSKRIQGNRLKGYHLPVDVCEMVDQIQIVRGGLANHHVAEAVIAYFFAMKKEYREAEGPEYWGKALDAMQHIDRLHNRRHQKIIGKLT